MVNRFTGADTYIGHSVKKKKTLAAEPTGQGRQVPANFLVLMASHIACPKPLTLFAALKEKKITRSGAHDPLAGFKEPL